MQPQIVHEAEVHRQHVRLKIPIGVEVDGTRYEVDDWSMGGFGIESEITSRQPGERFPVKMVFPFEDFEISLRLDCQMVYIVEDNTRFGCKFLSLSQGQLSMFRYLVDAYLAGELVSGGDILAVAGRDNSAEGRVGPINFNPYAAEESAGQKTKRLLGYGLFGLAGVALAVLVALGVKERYLTVRAETAVVEAPVTQVRTPTAGLVELAPPRELYRPGDLIGNIRGADGRISLIESPCECQLLDWLVPAGQYAQLGEAVAALVAADTPLLVRAQIDPDQASRLQIGARAEITLPGRDGVLLGQVDRIDFKPHLGVILGTSESTISRKLATVTVRPDEPFAFDELGMLVDVVFP